MKTIKVLIINKYKDKYLQVGRIIRIDYME